MQQQSIQTTPISPLLGRLELAMRCAEVYGHGGAYLDGLAAVVGLQSYETFSPRAERIDY
jgi:hypothetical protein